MRLNTWMRAVVAFTAIILLHAAYSFFCLNKSVISQTESTATAKPNEPIYECCIERTFNNKPPHRNILFLKTHKCASSTVQNILLRFGLKHGLNFALPKTISYLAYMVNFSESVLAPETKTRDKKYNMLVHHTRYRQNLRYIMYNDTISITILREPSTRFESSFRYFRLNKAYGKNFYEFLDFIPLAENGSSQMYNTFDEKAESACRINDRNQMCFDLGLSRNSFQNITKIKQFINEIDRQFDFVMISEHLEASLVLLANLLRWPLHYVAFLSLNSRPDVKKYKLSNIEKEKLVQFNYADFLLYDHFLKKFNNCVLQYGVDSLKKDVEKLKRINDQIRHKCVIHENEQGHKKTINYKLKTNDWICTHSVKLEPRFTEELKDVQKKRLEVLGTYSNNIM
ncbi:galactosylceramide sulfotransferase-like isoform X1 [Planococcus citri]|uniref:galactosylceramide sulfotransferase-like isoform X1 n=1 Tax=Planococcus citri TaxID=170843 RepID=UPI0031F83D16